MTFLSLKPATVASIALLVLAAAAAASLAAYAAVDERFLGDAGVTRLVQGFQPRWFDELMRWFSGVGGWIPMLMLLVSAGLLLYARAQQTHIMPLGLVALAAAAVPILKELIERPRPTAEVVEVLGSAGGFSFPSGHAFMAMAFFGAFIYLSRQMCGPRPWALWLLRGVAIFMILGVGLSRIYLGVHWASDVVGGYVMGALALYAVTKVFDYLRQRAPALDELNVPG